jgi:hypothetical protein
VSATEIARAVIILLTPYLVELGKSIAKKAGDAAWEKTIALHQAIKERFAKEQSNDFNQALQKFEEQPESRQGGFQDVLVELLQKDPGFAVSLSRLLEEVQGDKSATFITSVSGGKVGEIFNINYLEGDLTFYKGTRTSPIQSDSSGTEAERESFTGLRRNLATYFNIGELRSLCQDLGADYENLSSETKVDLVRELVMYCERHGRIPKLIATCRELRPHVPNWEV